MISLAFLCLFVGFIFFCMFIMALGARTIVKDRAEKGAQEEQAKEHETNPQENPEP